LSEDSCEIRVEDLEANVEIAFVKIVAYVPSNFIILSSFLEMKRKSQGCPLLACSDHTKDQIFFKDISYLDDGVEESEYVDKSFERWM